MASQSFYRKWRSQTFGDVVGQDHVTRTLRNALQMGRIAHAYLLCGPRGVGKTSVARILAKAINCEQPREGEPCNECPMCKAITEGRALDVIEIDAASNRRIEEMRDLREKVNFAPSEARHKVYILDEAHMLTGEASNALLKTLEEPPPHTVFVLVTTEAHRILETITSRCQRFNFRRISVRETVQQLNLICQREGLAVAPEALALVARVATGSLRDAEGMLEQLVGYCGREIGEAQARDVLGLSGEEGIQRLTQAVLDGDLAEGLKVINEIADSGVDLGRFGEDLVAYLRRVMLVKSGAVTALGELSGDALDALRACAERTTLEHLVRAIRIFSGEELGTRGGVAPQLALELALAEAILQNEKAQRSPASRVGSERSTAGPAPPTQPAERIMRPMPVGRGPDIARPAPVERQQEAPRVAAGPPENGKDGMPAPPRVAARQTPPTPDELPGLFESLKRLWKTELVDTHFATSKLLQAVLRDCGPYEVRGGRIVIGCNAPFHRDKIGEGEHRRAVEKAIAEVLGTVVPLDFEVVPQAKRGQPPPATSDPLVKEVLGWGGRIRRVVSEPETENKVDQPAERPDEDGEEVNDEP